MWPGGMSRCLSSPKHRATASACAAAMWSRSDSALRGGDKRPVSSRSASRMRS